MPNEVYIDRQDQFCPYINCNWCNNALLAPLDTVAHEVTLFIIYDRLNFIDAP